MRLGDGVCKVLRHSLEGLYETKEVHVHFIFASRQRELIVSLAHRDIHKVVPSAQIVDVLYLL